MNSVSNFDYAQMFGDAAATDSNVSNGNGTDAGLPFYTVADPASVGTAQVNINASSGFWSNLGSNLLNTAVSTLPTVVSGLVTPSTPDPTKAGIVNSGLKPSSSMTVWLIGGLVAVALAVAGFFLLRKKQKG